MAMEELKISVRVSLGWKVSALLLVLMLLATIREIAQGHCVWALVALCITVVHGIEVFIAWRVNRNIAAERRAAGRLAAMYAAQREEAARQQ